MGGWLVGWLVGWLELVGVGWQLVGEFRSESVGGHGRPIRCNDLKWVSLWDVPLKFIHSIDVDSFGPGAASKTLAFIGRGAFSDAANPDQRFRATGFGFWRSFWAH